MGRIEGEPECGFAQYSLHTAGVRMVPNCERPSVKVGVSEYCEWFKRQSNNGSHSLTASDVTHVCRRCIEARALGPSE